MKFKSLLALMVFVLTTGVAGVQIMDIELSKGGEPQEYINYGGEDMSYNLECKLAGNMTDVANITWYLSPTPWPVYTWNAHTQLASVNDPLRQMVAQPDGPQRDGHVIKFIDPRPLAVGFYTCKVFLNAAAPVNPLHKEYQLKMFALSHSDYTMSATESNCTILWSFVTPTMFPKPKVTCGFWDPVHETFNKTVYGGLQYLQHMNSTWSVSMAETLLSVDMIPMKTRLKCITEVALANYTVETEVNSTSNVIYQKVDDEGCPAIDIQGRGNMDVNFQECEFNCRDQCHPIGVSPVIATVSCNDHYSAYWPNDTFTFGWRLRVTCTKTTWSSEGGSPSTSLTLPYCLWVDSACGVSPNVALLALAAVVLLVHHQLTKH